MKVEVKNSITNKDYINAFFTEVTRIPNQISALIEERNIIIKLTNNTKDIHPIDRLEYYDMYREHTPTKGLMSESKNCIAICYDNTSIEEIGAILYHELGHFIDSYNNFGQIRNLYDLTYSLHPDFVNAYRQDLIENFSKIEKDKNIDLEHFIQGSTPQKIIQSAIPETFAEIFSYLNNKSNQNKILESYFKHSIRTSKKLLKFLQL